MMKDFEDVRVKIQTIFGVNDIEAKNMIKAYEIEPVRMKFQSDYLPERDGMDPFMAFCKKCRTKENNETLKECCKYWLGLVEGVGTHD